MGHKLLDSELREKAIIVGLYLSRWNEDGLEALGFESFRQAYNALGYAIGVSPNSIKNYRDEFDPYFDNGRQGHKRLSPREYCIDVMNRYAGWSIGRLGDLVKGFAFNDQAVRTLLGNIGILNDEIAVSNRLITGRAAEEYFKTNVSLVPQFHGFSLTDTTQLGCGFDFSLVRNEDFFGVEVKGLAGKNGSILMTEKEFSVAGQLGARYCLFIVSNFNEVPRHECVFDPLKSRIKFSKVEIMQISYGGRV